MVQLQTFTTSDYLLKNDFFDYNYKKKKKNLFNSFELGKKI